MIDGQNFKPAKNNFRAYYDIQKIVTVHGDDYTSSCLLDYNYFNKYYKMIPIDLSKKQALDADPKGVQQINFTVNLNCGLNVNASTLLFLIIEEAKETILDFSKGTVLKGTL